MKTIPKLKPKEISKEHLCYIAGLLEGEGYFVSHRDIFIGCSMQDREPLQRLVDVAGGVVWGPLTWKGGRRPYFKWNLSRPHGCMELAKELYSLMSPRRQQQIREMIERDVIVPRRKKYHEN